MATRWLVVRLIVGDKGAPVVARFLDQVEAALGEIDVEVSGVLTDNGRGAPGMRQFLVGHLVLAFACM